MDQRTARIKATNVGIKILKAKGYHMSVWQNPDASKKKKEYKACVQRMIDRGETLEEIEKNRLE